MEMYEPEDLSELASSGVNFTSETLAKLAEPLFDTTAAEDRSSLLYGADDGQIERFCETLGKLAIKDDLALRALSHLACILGGQNPAISILKKISKADSALDIAIERTFSSNDYVRLEALIAIDVIGGDRAADPLVAALNDRSYKIREHAAACLGYYSATKVMTPLIDALMKEKDALVVRAIIKSLSRLKDRRCASYVKKYLDTEIELLKTGFGYSTAEISNLVNNEHEFNQRFPDSSLLLAKHLLNNL